MALLRRPTREFSFTEHQQRTNGPPPGPELDGMLREMREAIISTQEALQQLRRDDGQLRNELVGPEQLKGNLAGTLIGDVRKVTELLTQQVRAAITTSAVTAQDISLFAKDAEAAATSAQQWLGQIQSIETRLLAITRSTETRIISVETQATDAENWSTNAQGHADAASRSADNSLAWSEYLAGPVVSGPEAPAFISQSAYPNGLFYQPILGMGGMGGLWSAKWWAIYCSMLVGWMTSLYLGAWDHHPAPGETNLLTGQVVPDPIPPGSMYFNTVDHKLYIWTGDHWVAQFSLTGGVISRFNYKATANQTVFSGPDLSGNQPGFDADTEHDVHVNGVKLTRSDGLNGGDYTVDDATDALTLLFPVTANSIVQWDLLVSADDLRPGAAIIFKIDPLIPDGVTTVFTLTYMSGTMSPLITKPEELMVVVDGVVQEPRTDFSAIDDTLTMFVPVSATSRMWAIYFRSGNITALEAAAPPAPVIILSSATVLESAPIGTVIGTFTVNNPHTGTPTYLLSDDAGGKFAIVGNELRLAGALDFETAISHSITVTVSGTTPDAADRTFNIVVQDVAEVVVGQITLTGNTVSEAAIIGATIGTFGTVNTTGSSPVFTLIDNAGGKLFVSGNSLRVAAPLDFDVTSTLSITVAVTGVLPATANRVFIIIVTPVELSTQIILSSDTVLENAVAGTAIGTLSVTAGTTGTPSYTLVDSAGGLFVLDGITLKTTAPLDYETATSYNVTIAVTGVSPATPARTFTVNVIDIFENIPPTITSSSSVVNVEMTTLAHVLTATDEIGVTWSIVGGADMAHFELVAPNTLRWTGGGTKDYETPGSSLGTNAYVVQVRATDPGALFVNQTITVNVTDVVETLPGLGVGSAMLGGGLFPVVITGRAADAGKEANIGGVMVNL